MGAYYTMVHWLQHHMLTCPSKKLLYIDCPGCGLQRSVIALLNGDVHTSWNLYPPTLFVLPTLIFLALHLSFDFRHGAFVLKCLYIVTTIAVIANYIYKISTNQLL